MAVRVNLDGRIVPPEQAWVPIFDRSFLYGDSVYETLRTYAGRLFALGPHLDRMWRSMERIRLAPPLDRAGVERRVRETLDVAGNAESYVRIVVTRGTGEFGLAAGLASPGSLYVIVREFRPVDPAVYERGIRLRIAATRRLPRASLDPAIKSGNYLNSILAMIEAREAGDDDAVMLNVDGFATEATTSSLFAVLDGVLATPPLSAGILEGVTRRVALDAAREAGIPAVELNLAADDLRRADELFLTSTLKEVVPVRTLDGAPTRTAAPGPVTARMRGLVSARIRALLPGEAA